MRKGNGRGFDVRLEIKDLEAATGGEIKWPNERFPRPVAHQLAIPHPRWLHYGVSDC